MKRINIVCVIFACVPAMLDGYVFYNLSDDPSDVITVVGFKNEKNAMKFMEQMGWTGEVETVSDYGAGASHFMPILALPPFCIVTPMIFVTPRIAESVIMGRYVIAEHRNLLPKSVWQAASAPIQKKERYSAAWNWRDIVREKGEDLANIYFLVFRRYERDITSLDSLLGATRPGEKYRTEIVAAGFGNRAAAINYRGAGKALELLWPFVPANFKKLIKTEKIPDTFIKFVTAEKGFNKDLILYQKRTGISMKELKKMEEENQPIKIEPAKAKEMVKKEYEAVKK